MSVLELHTPYVIGIAGGTGSGKTTFSKALVKRLNTHRIVYLSHDSYYRDYAELPLEERSHLNFDHPDALETELLIQHILDLKEGCSVDVPVYDFKTHTRTEEVIHLKPQPVILVEGILIFAIPELRELMDMRLFVDTEADIRIMRRLKRDIEERGRTMESVYEQYLSEVRPMHNAFVEPSKRFADVIVPNGGQNRAALDMLVAGIRERLAAHDANHPTQK